jgi:hypothetical protein
VTHRDEHLELAAVYALGALDGEDRAHFEAHLAGGCAICEVAARVRRGGHDIPEGKIRERYDDSRRNLVRLLPHLETLRAYDNSEEAAAPEPRLLLEMRAQRIARAELATAPDWVKPIMAAALALDSRPRGVARR